MNKTRILSVFGFFMWAAYSWAGTVTTVLEASKDTFCRSNERNRNNGASPQLLIANSPGVRTIIGFDLSAVSNEITKAEFRIRMQSDMPDPVSFVVMPMATTKNNGTWEEGSGALGSQGRNARVGEATYSWRAYRDQPWESETGAALTDIGDSALWKKPAIGHGPIRWQADEWISIPIENLSGLEKIRKSKLQRLTFGVWGTGGNGLYAFGSKESGHAPQLVLEVKEIKKWRLQ